ncbi:MAG: hypothetical protein JNL09_03700 [Anaerolineales bacterium]|nr:hypothetical protein [Anaerolineales bacterium]
MKTALAALRWNRTSYVLLSMFLLTLFVIGYVWWPLAEEYLALFNPRLPWWVQFDWLLLGIFLVMTILIMCGADMKRDALIVSVGMVGGLVIEAWGTQTNLWHYYTNERPPLWIIPAWPIASLAIDRLYRASHALLGSKILTAQNPNPNHSIAQLPNFHFSNSLILLYWFIFLGFFALMLAFVWPTLDKSLTLVALALSTFLIATPTNYRAAVLIFVAGSALGYFLELWGTTRECWIYYTGETPPLFAVLAHGMAAVAFWRTGLLITLLASRLPISRSIRFSR